MGHGVNNIVPESNLAPHGFPNNYEALRQRWALMEKRYLRIGFIPLSIDYWMRADKNSRWVGWCPNGHDLELFVKVNALDDDEILHAERFEEWYGAKTLGHFMRLSAFEGMGKLVSTITKIG